ncbi:MAG: hypothetical protein Q9166_003247 [cf. Caloplaca sp. 2 TL-2023]
MVETRRLYVSPLDPELLPIVLPGPLRDLASNISYHTLQTLEDKRYGYLDLPAPEADRLQKKLHGSILKGVKMKVEKARPEKVGTISEATQEESSRKNDPERKKRAKSKNEDGVLPGLELPDGRKVKRGWTEPNAKEENKSTRRTKSESKDTVKKASAHTDGPECLFKARLPPNSSGNSALGPSAATKSKKRKRGESERDIVVHEFDKTTKQASFLREEKRSREKKPASSYVEGKGWLDQDGHIIEEERQTRRTMHEAHGADDEDGKSVSAQDTVIKGTKTRAAGRSKKSGAVDKHRRAATQGPILNGASDIESGGTTTTLKVQSPPPDEQDEGSSKDGNSSEGGDSSEADDEVNTDQVRALSINRSSPTRPIETSKDAHPLEALFKRPQTAASQTPRKPSLEVKTGFSFFGPDEDEPGDITVAIPQTPFTQQDFQERRHRSAAPTPDTAAPGKTFFGRLWSQESKGRDSVTDEDEAEEDSTSTPVAAAPSVEKEPEGEADESEFVKWFYEHRGETNRAWKRRRREAAKEKRQKENKRR